MASRSPMSSFRTFAERLRSQNQSHDPADTPTVLLQNPLLQLHIETARTILPPELARHLDQAVTLQTCLDWFGVAALYRQTLGNPLERRMFLEQLRRNPDPANVMAAAIAAKAASQIGPTSRDAVWQLLDRLGVVLQVFALGLLLCARAVVMHLAAMKWPHLWACLASVPRHLVGSGDLSSSLMPVSGGSGAFWLLVMAAWLFLEYRKAPALLEYCRQLPARRRGRPLPASSREEALLWLWRLQCVATLVYLVIRWVAG